MKRRNFLTGLATGSLVSAIGYRSVIAAGHEKNEHTVDYLFVQHARAVSLKAGVLKLDGVAPDTLYFADRPDRIVGRVATKRFVDDWAVGEDSFADDPPNAVLSIHHEPSPQDIVVVLRNPRYEDAGLVYDAEVLDGEKEARGTAAALFIDVIGRPLTPVSIAGAKRRDRRRDRREDRRD